MNIIGYNPALHKDFLIALWAEWNIATFSLELLSSTGLIIPDQACMFIYETNSPIVLFENLVCSKKSSKDERNNNINALISYGKEYVRTRGYKHILLTTNNPSILQRAKEDNCIISKDMFYCVLKEA